MAISKWLLNNAEAFAKQMVLPLGLPKWNTPRPSTRLGRAIRSHIAAVLKVRGLRWVPDVLVLRPCDSKVIELSKVLKKEWGFKIKSFVQSALSFV